MKRECFAVNAHTEEQIKRIAGALNTDRGDVLGVLLKTLSRDERNFDALIDFNESSNNHGPAPTAMEACFHLDDLTDALLKHACMQVLGRCDMTNDRSQFVRLLLAYYGTFVELVAPTPKNGTLLPWPRERVAG